MKCIRVLVMGKEKRVRETRTFYSTKPTHFQGFYSLCSAGGSFNIGAWQPMVLALWREEKSLVGQLGVAIKVR